MLPNTKDCDICQTTFSTLGKGKFRKLRCSPKCSALAKQANNKEWSKDNPHKVKATNLKTKKTRYANGKAQAYQRLRRSTKEGYVDRFLERAKTITDDTNLTRVGLLELMSEDSCNLTGVKFKYVRNGSSVFQNPKAPSIDRIDSNRGYYKDNVWIVLSTVNFAKNAAPLDEFTATWFEIMKSWEALENNGN